MEKILEQILEKLVNSDRPAEAIKELRGLLEDQYKYEKEKRESFLKQIKECEEERKVVVDGTIEDLSSFHLHEPLCLVLRQNNGSLISVMYNYNNSNSEMIYERLKTAKDNNKRVILHCEREDSDGILRGQYKIQVLD